MVVDNGAVCVFLQHKTTVDNKQHIWSRTYVYVQHIAT